MGFVKLTARFAVASLILFVMALLIETEFRILGEWAKGIRQFTAGGGGLSKQAWVTIAMVAFFGWILYENKTS